MWIADTPAESSKEEVIALALAVGRGRIQMMG
jgi:hypothetical protein